MLSHNILTAIEKTGASTFDIGLWLGTPCGCRERAEKMVALNRWALRVNRGKLENAREYLYGIMGLTAPV